LETVAGLKTGAGIAQVKSGWLIFNKVDCTEKPGQQLQTQSGEHKSAACFSSVAPAISFTTVCSCTLTCGAPSAQVTHDKNIMKMLNIIAGHFIQSKCIKKMQ